MSSEVAVTMHLNGKEILSADDAPAADVQSGRELLADGLRVSKTLNATTTPAVEAGPAVYDVTMSGSTQSIDLTAAALQGGRTQDMSGLKVIAVKVLANAANAGAVTVRAHATNGYDLFGAGTTGIAFAKGQQMVMAFTEVASQRDAIDATHKIVELAGASGYKIKLVIYFGDSA